LIEFPTMAVVQPAYHSFPNFGLDCDYYPSVIGES
jgi:hypothetical protein